MSPRRRRSSLCRTISTPIAHHRSTPPFPPLRRGGWSDGSSGATLRSTEAGLDMAESELSVLSRQCLDRRIPGIGTLDSALVKTERACRARDLELSSSEKLAFFSAQQPGDDCLPDRSRSA